jgi:chromosome segregation ATPase
LQMLTEELEGQKCEMETEIHILLDIEAEKSRAISALQLQLRNSEATERALHDKLAVLTDNFAALEDHISIIKERLLSADARNQQGEDELQAAEEALASKEESVVALKEQEVRLRQQLEREQAREARREKELGELITEN